MAGVSVQQVTKSFGPVEVLQKLDLEIDDGEFLVLVGPSGCGKTTLLRMIAGLEPVTEGNILIGGHDVTWVAPKDRDIAMVFQSYALYPHMTASDNMSFGLRLQGMSKADIDVRVAEAARMLKIDHLLERKPRELSGGQRQRVAMGRAIVRRPKLYLFDEPLSNLDAQLRAGMRTEIKRMHIAEKKTVIYVTHDQIEALTLADRIVAMDKGSVQQIGTPDELYNRPASLFVASFIGSPAMSFLSARLVDSGDGLGVCFNGNSVSIGLPSSWSDLKATRRDAEVLVGIRPESLHYGRNGSGAIELKVNVIEPCGAEVYVIGGVGDTEVTARCEPGNVPALHDRARFAVDVDKLHIFDPLTKRSLRP